MILERRPRAPFLRAFEQRRRKIEPIDAESCLCEQVTVPSLAARHVEYSRSGGQAEHLDNTRDFAPVALEREQRFVFAQVLEVEIPRPPLALRRRQKNTGSRYAPNTLSSAARISYSVQ